MKKLTTLFKCDNCSLIIHEDDMYIPNLYGKALYIGKYGQANVN